MNRKPIKIGMVGFGTVGRGVWEILEEHGSLLSRRVGAPLELKKIAVRSKSKKRGAAPAKLFTEDARELLRDPEIAMVVEVMGGTKEAKSLAL
ncbi:MAG TPA: homoserine dehydrogenase, partial [bacterium]|nr:homoserine dehydrogenase [bacterium]